MCFCWDNGELRVFRMIGIQESSLPATLRFLRSRIYKFSCGNARLNGGESQRWRQGESFRHEIVDVTDQKSLLLILLLSFRKEGKSCVVYFDPWMDIRILVFLTVILIFRWHRIRIKFVILQEIFDMDVSVMDYYVIALYLWVGDGSGRSELVVFRLDVTRKILENSLVLIDGWIWRVIIPPKPLTLKFLMGDGHHHRQENQSYLHL